MKAKFWIIAATFTIIAAFLTQSNLSTANATPAGSIYLQTDPQWANDRIGGSSQKIAAAGCTICCISMALEYCGIAIEPGQLNEHLKNNKGYTDRGWVKWFTVAKVTDDKITIELPNKPEYEKIDSTLALGYPVIAKVMINRKITHWVLIVSKDGHDYLIKDPLGNGKTLDKLSKYNSKIHSIRIFKSKTSKTGLLPKTKSASPTRETVVDVKPSYTKQTSPTITIRSSIDAATWNNKSAISPLKGQKLSLKVETIAGASVRWYQIIPDIRKIYNNANMPWEENAYQWKGFDKIDYHRKELTQFRGKWQIEPFDVKHKTKLSRKTHPQLSPADKITNSQYYHEDVGSFWFQAEVTANGKLYRSPGIDETDHRGISPKTLRVSIRSTHGYVGYLTSFFNVPGLFGSVTYQSSNYIGADCADVLMAARSVWKNQPLQKNYNVAMLVGKLQKIAEIDLSDGTPSKTLSWQKDIRPGDFIAVRYPGSRQYGHIGALYSDTNKNNVLDPADTVIHAGPYPLHLSKLKQGNFNGKIAILRP